MDGPYVVRRTTPANVPVTNGPHPQVKVVVSADHLEMVKARMNSGEQPPNKIRIVEANPQPQPVLSEDPLQLPTEEEMNWVNEEEEEASAEEPTEQDETSMDKSETTVSADTEIPEEISLQSAPEEAHQIVQASLSFENRRFVSFMKSDCFQGQFDKSLTSCMELNRNIVSNKQAVRNITKTKQPFLLSVICEL